MSISHALVVRSFECFKQSGLDASDQEPGPGLPEGCGMTLVLFVVACSYPPQHTNYNRMGSKKQNCIKLHFSQEDVEKYLLSQGAGAAEAQRNRK